MSKLECEDILETIFNSFFIVALTEMGDKTQLLALVLAMKFKKPWTIMLGILVATILNHAFASWVGIQASNLIPANYLKWILAISFFGFSIWVLIPDKDEGLDEKKGLGAFLTTVTTFFMAEMGDKTQLATVALAAKYSSLTFVTIGSTLGMMLTSALAVFAGDKLTKHISMTWIHRVAAVIYFISGIVILLK